MIALGTPITYTHQAAVARKAGKDQWIEAGAWFIPAKGNGEVPADLMPGKAWLPETGRPFIYVNTDGEQLSAESIEKFNRAIVAWESPGSGVVTGLVTKLYGVSEPSGYSSNYYGEGEFDQGYLVMHGKAELYTVRWELKGSKFVYVPTWAAQPQIWKETTSD